MTDRPDPDEPRRPGPEAPAGSAGAGHPGSGGSGAPTPGLAAGSRHYQDLAIARRLRRGRASLGMIGRPAPTPAPTGSTTPPRGPGDAAEPRSGRGRRARAVSLAAGLVALLLGGAAAVMVLPEGAPGVRANLPGRPAPEPGVRAPATTGGDGTATTDAGGATGLITGGQLPQSTGADLPVDRGPDGSSAPPPTTWAGSPYPPGTLPVPPLFPTTGPPTTVPQLTTTSTAATPKSTKPTRPEHPTTTRRRPPPRNGGLDPWAPGPVAPAG